MLPILYILGAHFNTRGGERSDIPGGLAESGVIKPLLWSGNVNLYVSDLVTNPPMTDGLVRRKVVGHPLNQLWVDMRLT